MVIAKHYFQLFISHSFGYLRHSLSLRNKFIIVLISSILWFILCMWLSKYWVRYLATLVGYIPAFMIICIIALIPGFMNFFLTCSYLIDKRPVTKTFEDYPGVSILIAAYNEENYIGATLESVINQVYPGPFEIFVINDGSQDNTIEQVKLFLDCPYLNLIEGKHTGKAKALNLGLESCQYNLIATVDADTLLMQDSLYQLVARLLSESPKTAAVAGSVYLKNGDHNYLTQLQYWDYFNAIQAIKRVQSFLKGTLVAQGAFSIYRKEVLTAVGGWPDAIGEDIVLTWKILVEGFDVAHAELAIAFTNAPESYKQFFHQRSRWARGMLEAFSIAPKIVIKRRLSTFFIYWNLLFPIMDFAYVFIFIPGIIAAFFGYYFIAGPMTLAVLPLAIVQNLIFAQTQRKIFKTYELPIRAFHSGFFSYILFYNFFMCPACIYGYVSYWLRLRRIWGTK